MNTLGKTGPFLWIALDALTERENKTLDTAWELNELSGAFGFKVNIDWVMKHGAHNARIHLPDRPVFADMKAWNGASTMARLFNVLGEADFNATSVYALAGGYDEERGNELKRAITLFCRNVGENAQLRIYAVTLLTHYGEAYSQHHFGRTFCDEAGCLAKEGIAAGAHGIIIPGTLLPSFSHLDVVKIIPGIRDAGFPNDGRHKQVVRPEDLAGRVDVEAVCGGPIMNSLDPKTTLERMLRVLQG